MKRTERFREIVGLAIEDAGLEVTYSDIERLTHGAMGLANRLPWWKMHKGHIYRTEGGEENIALAFAGLVIGHLASGLDQGKAMVAATKDYTSLLARQYDVNGLNPDGTRYITQQPITFTQIEEGMKRDFDENNYELGDKLAVIMLEPGDVPQEETNGNFTDPRLQELWKKATPDQRELLRLLGNGVTGIQASALLGKGRQWASEQLKQLRGS